MEIALALSFQGSVADSHFDPVKDKSNPHSVPTQFRTYIQENNTHTLSDDLLSKKDLNDFLYTVNNKESFSLQRISKNLLN